MNKNKITAVFAAMVAGLELAAMPTKVSLDGLRDRSYGVNTGGLYDLYRRPKLVVDEIRRLYTSKPE